MSDIFKSYVAGQIKFLSDISISTGGTAVDFGNAQASAGYACNSNGHGGLG